MNIYIYSDESGVFDKEHNDYFVLEHLRNEQGNEIENTKNLNVIYLP